MPSSSPRDNIEVDNVIKIDYEKYYIYNNISIKNCQFDGTYFSDNYLKKNSKSLKIDVSSQAYFYEITIPCAA